ncbi:hypothetical protein CYMTET_53618 [Cymbomonas tetramitiformis]|uniref:Uncharacterized protein n=1 Tax=Cymbomonas tetramitiformis TaxID=36881 RepID=A0AAE0EPW2_9CHLO|nr:hypothetical protein CYMTET_53618 [Cymbomonas tetramitiformis]
MADSDADAFTGTPVPPEIDARRALTFSSGPEEPFPVTPAAVIPEGLSAPERDARAFAVDCRELLRTPGKHAEIILQVRERCRHQKQKTHDWYFDYDTTKGQVARELELARRVALVSHSYLFGGTPTVTMLVGIDPKPHTTEFIQHYTAAPRETVCGLSAEAIWGAGFGIDLVLARRMCPEYNKDLLVNYDKTTDEGKKKRALGLVMFTLEVDALHQQQSEAGALLKKKKKEDSATALAATILSGESLTPATLAQLSISRRHVEQLQGDRGHSARARGDEQSGVVRDRSGGNRHVARTPTHSTPRHGRKPSQPGPHEPKAAAYMSECTKVSLLLSTLDEIYAEGDDHSYGALFASQSLSLAVEADTCDAALSAVILDDDYLPLEVGLWYGCGQSETAYTAAVARYRVAAEADTRGG